MADDRIDLSADLDNITGGLLDDVRVATEQAKKRVADDRAKDARNAEKTKSRKTSGIIIASAAVVLVLLSYFLVFGSGNGSDAAADSGAATAKAMNAPIQSQAATKAAPKAPPKVAVPTGQRPQSAQHPPEGYEQPSQDPPM